MGSGATYGLGSQRKSSRFIVLLSWGGVVTGGKRLWGKWISCLRCIKAWQCPGQKDLRLRNLKTLLRGCKLEGNNL